MTRAAAAFLLATACAHAPAPVDGSSTARITAEVIAAARGLPDGCERLDVDRVLRTAQDAPEFLYVDWTGTMRDRPAMQRFLGEMFGEVAALRYTTLQEQVRVLAPDLALHTWTFRTDVTLKSGDKLVVEPVVATHLMRLVGGAWKVAYLQESHRPPRKAPPPAADGR